MFLFIEYDLAHLVGSSYIVHQLSSLFFALLVIPSRTLSSFPEVLHAPSSQCKNSSTN